MKTELSFLEMLNQNPMAGALLLAILLVVQQIIRAWKGGSDASRIEQEAIKLLRQTSETVNKCSERTGKVMDATKDVIITIEKYLATNDFGRLSARLNDAVQMLEAMASHKDIHHSALERVSDLCHDIATDLQRTDSRVVHADILHKIEAIETIANDNKRILISVSEKTQ